MKFLFTLLVLSVTILSRAQDLCFYDPNTGALFNNMSLAIYDITPGDFNSDGHLDVVTANSTAANISFIPGDGNGMLGQADTIPVPTGIFCIASGDFDNDGKLDIATANAMQTFVLLGNGDGTFDEAVTYDGGSPSRIYSRDVNGDNILDLVTGQSGIQILHGVGDGTFLPPVLYPTLGAETDFTIADFDNDGVVDIVATTRISWVLSVLSFLKGNPDGVFSNSVAISVPHHGIFGINSYDADNDGNVDLVVSNHNNTMHRIEIYFGNGDGSFESPVFYPVFLNPNYVYLADMNNDLITDIVVPEGSGYSILAGNGDGAFEPYQYFVASPGPNGIAIGDYNEDGQQDLVIPSSSAGLLTMNLNCTTTAVGNIDSQDISDMDFFPNPVSVTATIDFKNVLSDPTLQIFNLYGQEIKMIYSVSGSSIELNLDNLADGIYFVQLCEGNKIIAANKMVIAH